MKIIKIYTDGGYKSDINKGAIAFLVIKEGKQIFECSKIVEEGEMSNTVMEMKAILTALNWLRSNKISPKQYMIYLYTDSQQIQISITNWLEKWKKNKWRNSRNKPVKHLELWKKIDNLISNEFPNLYVHWIEGHKGDNYNSRVDELCTITMRNFKKSKIDVKDV